MGGLVAMALGKIVIASNVGAVSEMFEQNITGHLYPVNDITALTGLMENTWNNDRELKQSEKIRAVAFEKFAPIQIARKTTDFYRSILN